MALGVVSDCFYGDANAERYGGLKLLLDSVEFLDSTLKIRKFRARIFLNALAL